MNIYLGVNYSIGDQDRSKYFLVKSMSNLDDSEYVLKEYPIYKGLTYKLRLQHYGKAIVDK